MFDHFQHAESSGQNNFTNSLNESSSGQTNSGADSTLQTDVYSSSDRGDGWILKWSTTFQHGQSRLELQSYDVFKETSSRQVTSAMHSTPESNVYTSSPILFTMPFRTGMYALHNHVRFSGTSVREPARLFGLDFGAENNTADRNAGGTEVTAATESDPYCRL